MAEVSIVTSVYNKAPWLEKCLNSFCMQTFSDISIIVINNGSTDKSKDIIEKFANADDRIQVVNIKDNIGPSGAYGMGINLVETDYFTLCDADDYIPNNYIEVLYRKINEYDADIAMCTNDRVWDDGKVVENKRPPKNEILFTGIDINKLLPQIIDHHSDQYLGYHLPEIGALWGKLYRTQFVRNSGITYDKDVWIYCDWLFNFSLVRKIRKIIYTEETLYHFYQSEGSVTRAKEMNWEDKNRRKIVINRFSDLCEECDSNLKKALNRFYYVNIMATFNMYISHYPKDVSTKEVKKIGKEIAAWKQMDFLLKNGMFGLNFMQKIILLCIKIGVFTPIVIAKKIL